MLFPLVNDAELDLGALGAFLCRGGRTLKGVADGTRVLATGRGGGGVLEVEAKAALGPIGTGIFLGAVGVAAGGGAEEADGCDGRRIGCACTGVCKGGSLSSALIMGIS